MKLSIIITFVFFVLMIVNLHLENKEMKGSSLSLANIQLLNANAEPPGEGTGCRLGCQTSTNYSDYCFYCTTCNGQFYQISIGGSGTCS